jgi:hypothetical protein
VWDGDFERPGECAGVRGGVGGGELRNWGIEEVGKQGISIPEGSQRR